MPPTRSARGDDEDMQTLECFLRTAATSAVVALFVATGAAADPPPACVPDALKFCQGVPAGAGYVLGCLEEHARELDPACRTALEATKRRADQPHTVRPARAAWVGPCNGDIEKLCKDAPAGAKQIATCLAQHRSGLSDACKAAFGTTGK